MPLVFSNISGIFFTLLLLNSKKCSNFAVANESLQTYYKKRLLALILVWFTRATELRINKGKVPRFLCIYTNGAFGADVPRKEKLHEKVIIISTKSVLM